MTDYLDSGTVPVYILPARQYDDTDTVRVSLVITAVEYLIQYTPAFSGDAFNKWSGTVTEVKKWRGTIGDNKWYGTLQKGIEEEDA